MKNLTLKKIADVVGGTLFNEAYDNGTEIEGVVIDSRKIEWDFLFVAIVGERVDGHSFVNDVFEKGAKCAIVEHQMEKITEHPYIVVDSSLQALKDLAEYYRSVLDIKVVGITGSVGKTSTKEFIASVLSEKYSVLKTEGNFNNEIGLPLTVFNIDEFHEIAVLEMGISDFNEMSRLAKIARPDICVITNIGLCHLENLGSRDGVLKAKTEMFDYANKGFIPILNGDDDKLSSLSIVNGSTSIFYGMNNTNDIYVTNININGIEGSSFDIVTKGGVIPVSISIPGEHMIYNAMAATAVGLSMGLTLKEIKSGIEKLENLGGRLNIVKKMNMTIIDDCYNANPISTKASIDVLTYAKGRKVAILGDMLELGQDEKQLHEDLGKYISDKQVDMVICIGELSKNTYNGLIDGQFEGEFHHFDTIEDFLVKRNKLIEAGDTILVKASHSMHFETIVEMIGTDVKFSDKIKYRLNKFKNFCRESKLNMCIGVAAIIIILQLIAISGIVVAKKIDTNPDTEKKAEVETTTEQDTTLKAETEDEEKEEFTTKIDEMETNNLVYSPSILDVDLKRNASWSENGKYYIQYVFNASNISLSTVEDFALLFNFDSEYELTDSWDVSTKEGDNYLVVNPLNKNKEISVGGVVSGGFIVSGNDYVNVEYITIYVGDNVETIKYEDKLYQTTTQGYIYIPPTSAEVTTENQTTTLREEESEDETTKKPKETTTSKKETTVKETETEEATEATEQENTPPATETTTPQEQTRESETTTEAPAQENTPPATETTTPQEQTRESETTTKAPAQEETTTASETNEETTETVE